MSYFPVEDWKKRAIDAERRLAALENMVFLLAKGLVSVKNLIKESSGVSGLHLNGDIASWDELRTGGRFEEWLLDFDKSLAAIEQGEKEDGK